MKVAKWMFITLVGLMIGVVSCAAPSEDKTTGDTIVYYGGSEPQGDLITVALNKTKKQVTHYNHTRGETNGPFTYSDLTDVSENGGFSILKVVNLDSNNMPPYGGFVYFAEFPDTALVYQMFKYTDAGHTIHEREGNPVYAVYREATTTSTYLEKPYNWMQFNTAFETTYADMEVGFAAIDDNTSGGLFYGAGYSYRAELEQGTNYAITTINKDTNNLLKLENMSYNSETVALVDWGGGSVGDYSNALSMVGTRSGAVVLDFGPERGGGAGIAIPQASSTNFVPPEGTYLLLVYECPISNTNGNVEPTKFVVEPGGNVAKVFDLQTNTSTGTPVYEGYFAPIYSFPEGPMGVPVAQTLSNASGISNANSSTIKGAYQALGAFVLTNTNENDIVFTMFDPNGNYMAFSAVCVGGDTTNILFGFGIKDPNYSDAGL